MFLYLDIVQSPLLSSQSRNFRSGGVVPAATCHCAEMLDHRRPVGWRDDVERRAGSRDELICCTQRILMQCGIYGRLGWTSMLSWHLAGFLGCSDDKTCSLENDIDNYYGSYFRFCCSIKFTYLKYRALTITNNIL